MRDLLCEKYAAAADHMTSNGALDAASFVTIFTPDRVFATIKFKEFKFVGPHATTQINESNEFLAVSYTVWSSHEANPRCYECLALRTI